MTCPRCYAEFQSRQGDCPECGVRLLRSVSGMLKTSAVMISAAGEDGFYHSVQDVPERLRQELLRATASENAGTIVIADRAGKEQLTQIVSRRETAKAAAGKPRVAGPKVSNTSGSAAPASSFLGLSWIVWAGAALLLGSAGVVAAVFTIHW
jgi:hypothetical protein